LPEYAQVRQGLIDVLREIDDICYVPQALGAFYFFLKIQTTQDEMALAKRLIQEFGVAVMPGGAFGMKNGCYFRVAYGALHKDSAEEGISRLIAGLKALTG
jgi:aspartate/methionine/tyrosine aminotransferase